MHLSMNIHVLTRKLLLRFDKILLSNTTERVCELSVPVTRGICKLSVPVTRGICELSVPVTRGICKLSVPFTEGVSKLSVPVYRMQLGLLSWKIPSMIYMYI
jgi:hypothetical protein